MVGSPSKREPLLLGEEVEVGEPVVDLLVPLLRLECSGAVHLHLVLITCIFDAGE